MTYSNGAWVNGNAARAASRWQSIKDGPTGPQRTAREERRAFERLLRGRK